MDPNSFLGLGFKMLQQAEKRWIGIYAPEKVHDLFAGVKFMDYRPIKSCRMTNRAPPEPMSGNAYTPELTYSSPFLSKSVQ